MDQKQYKLSDFVEAPSTSMIDPQISLHDRFVGLEHYDSREPVVSRFSGKEILTSTVKEFKKGDLLIARRNVYLERAGLAMFDGITSGDSIILRVKQCCEDSTGVPHELANRILPFVLNSNSFWAYANRHADGMNSKRISKDKILEYEFTLPSVEEQKVLAEKLWAAYELKQSYIKMIAATDEMVKSRFIEMFGGVVDNKYGFPVRKLSECCSYISDGSHFSPQEATEGKYPMLSVKDMTPNGFSYESCKYIDESDYQSLLSNGCKPLKDDVLVAKDGSYFKYAFALNDEMDQAVLSSIAILRPNTDMVCPKFLAYYMLTDEVVNLVERNYLTGTAIRRVILKGFKEIPTIVPPIEQQKAFIRILEQADKSKYTHL